MPKSQRKDYLKLKMNEYQEKKLEEVRLPGWEGALSDLFPKYQFFLSF